MTNMNRLTMIAVAAAFYVYLPASFAADAEVTWLDPTCGYFVVELPEGPEPEKFGLFSARGLPLPDVGDILQGSMTEIETELLNLTNGDRHTVIHWANAKLSEQLVRNTPVQCASKWSKRKKR